MRTSIYKAFEWGNTRIQKGALSSVNADMTEKYTPYRDINAPERLSN
jgi:hypothetical protein